jgi:signal transduction histidine kinase
MDIAAQTLPSNTPDNFGPHHISPKALRSSLERGCNAWARTLLNEMEVSGAVERALDQFLEASGQDRLQLFQVKPADTPEALLFERAGEANRADLAAVGPNRVDTPATGILPEDLTATLVSGRAFMAASDAWPATLKAHSRFAPQGSLLVVPIHAFGKLWGGLWFENAVCFPWDEDAIHTIEIAADLFAAYLERRQAIQARTERNKLAGALEMAGAVCHKLNQPMQIILGYSSMVTSGDIADPEQIREIVHLIEDETRRMGIITKNLMGITRYRTVTDPEGGTICDIDAPETSA